MLTSVGLTGCSSTGAKVDPLPVTIAKKEMQRQGWQRIEVDRCVFRDGLWLVELHEPRSGAARRYVCVRVSPDGAVLGVFQNLE